MIVRNLVLADRIPDELSLGFEKRRLTPDLTWVAVEGGRVVGVFVAFAAHGWFLPFRLCVVRAAPPACALKLLRQGFRDALNRGYDCYITVFDPTQRSGRTLLKILESRGESATVEGEMVCIGGRIAPLINVRELKAVANG